MEKILVLPREVLLPHLSGSGFLPEEQPQAILDLIAAQGRFVPREPAEINPAWKQPIPYGVVRRGRQFFLLRRLRAQTESRLHEKYSLGLGGHINPIDAEGGASPLSACLARELREEVSLPTIRAQRCIGLLHEEAGVSNFHLGVVYLIDVEGEVSIRETDKMTGEWIAPEDFAAYAPRMETWSQLLLPRLLHLTPPAAP